VSGRESGDGVWGVCVEWGEGKGRESGVGEQGMDLDLGREGTGEGRDRGCKG
jgi:hypothetical protein